MEAVVKVIVKLTSSELETLQNATELLYDIAEEICETGYANCCYEAIESINTILDEIVSGND